MRADAARNRALILEAAEEIFATEGATVPVDEVAQKAGVGVGTLYRHFPTKEALFEAIVTTRLEKLLQLATDYARSEDPGEALFAFLRQLADESAAKRDLIAALGLAGFDVKAHCSAMFDEMMQSIDVLLQRAAQAGAVRDDVPADEVVSLLAGACQARAVSGPGDEGLQRIVGVVIDGLARRAPADTRTTA
jgi:AcrR family transcriptional regulator